MATKQFFLKAVSGLFHPDSQGEKDVSLRVRRYRFLSKSRHTRRAKELELLKDMSKLAPHEIIERINSMPIAQSARNPVPSPDRRKEELLNLIEENGTIYRQQVASVK
jgi:hypothetical protein